MKARKNTGYTTFVYAVLICVAIIFILPVLWTLLNSLKIEKELNDAGGFMFWPKTWTLTNYVKALNPADVRYPIVSWFLTSVMVSSIHTVLAVIIFSMSAYAYAKLKFKGRNFIFLFMLFFASFPAIANIVPLYKIMTIFKWVNSPIALILPGLSGMFNIFLIRQFMYAIPDSLIEAAKIDGSSEARTFIYIIIPMCKPILVAVGLFSFTGIWNDFLWPSIIINDLSKLTLTAGLQLATSSLASHVPQLSSLAIISIAPIFILFLFTQKYFMNGVSLSAGIKE